MESITAYIMKGFINEMSDDFVGWNAEVIGKEAYQLFRLIENPSDIPEDKKGR